MRSTQSADKRPTKLRGPVLWWMIGLVAVIVGVGLIASIGAPRGFTDPILPAEGKTLGASNAPIVLEEYADFQCPFCGQFARDTLKQIEDQYVKTGTVKIVFRNYAKLGEESIRAAEAAECANEQGEFWSYYDTLYNNQAGENHGAFSDENLVKFAQTLNLDLAAFNTCFTTGQHRAAIQAETAAGRQRGVDRVPTLFINDQKFVGAISLQQFETIMSPLLSK